MARIVVAGGAGFIGSALCDTLIARGDRVVVIDNLISGRRENVGHLEGHDRFEFVFHDVRVAPISVPGPVDVVMNFASPASPSDFIRLSIEIMETGSVGTRNLLDLAIDKGARFLMASTSEVYGDPLVHPQPETYRGNVDSIGPRSCYDEAKRFAEALTMAYHRRHGLEVRIARIFNTYGPRMRPDDGRVVTNFIGAALSGAPLTLYGGGLQTRSYCYVTDEVAGLVALADSTFVGPVNIGSPYEFTVRELAETVVELTGSRSPIIVVGLPPEREGDPLLRRPDITLARRELHWEPTVALRVGLEQMIAWFRDQST